MRNEFIVVLMVCCVNKCHMDFVKASLRHPLDEIVRDDRNLIYPQIQKGRYGRKV